MVCPDAVEKRKAFEEDRQVQRITEKFKLILAFGKIFKLSPNHQAKLDAVIVEYIGMGDPTKPIKRGRDKTMEELHRLLVANNNPADPRWVRLTHTKLGMDRFMQVRKEIGGSMPVAALLTRMLRVII